MKVTVSFNTVKIVVPCGDGEKTVRELTQLATIRYKKATGKPRLSWVSVHSLKAKEGGILDPDDRLVDVCDDREQLIAYYDEEGVPQCGDGMSASSDESETTSGSYKNDFEADCGPPALQLQVRRGSEPSLNQLEHSEDNQAKRWSAAGLINRDQNLKSSKTDLSVINEASFYGNGNFDFDPGGNRLSPLPPPFERGQGSGAARDSDRPNPFARDANRLSIQIGHEEGRWLEAAENAKADSRPPEDFANQPMRPLRPPEDFAGGTNDAPGRLRREPLGGTSPPRASSEDLTHIVIHNEIGPLGIHVVPSGDPEAAGLVIQGIEPGGRIDRDGRLAVHDRIVQINGYSLTDIPFHKAQEIFKEALFTKELALVVEKAAGGQQELSPDAFDSEMFNPEENKENENEVGGTLGRRMGSTGPGSKAASSVQAANTRKIGRKLTVTLVKGVHGLGFSITTRDIQAGGVTPIYVKNILPKGAAIENGQLRPGDRLLEVNSESMDGKSQGEVVAILRNTPQYGEVNLVVSRQERVEEIEASTLDRRVKERNSGRSQGDSRDSTAPNTEESEEYTSISPDVSVNSNGEVVFPWKHREILTLDIPVHDTERAGLGVSVKGKTTGGGPNKSIVDLGIFVKSVIHGGAASRDGRLKTNDQLVNINGISLLGKANCDAMDTLRRAMHEEGPTPGVITLTVARRLLVPPQELTGGNRSRATGRDSVTSILTSSSGEDSFREYRISANNTTNSFETSQNETVIYVEKPKKPPVPTPAPAFDNFLAPAVPRNPVVDRLMGGGGGRARGKENKQQQQEPGLRNTSYYRATGHDTWNSTLLERLESPDGVNRPPLKSPTVHMVGGETVMIEQFERLHSSPDGAERSKLSDSDVTTSQPSLLEEDMPGFARDQPGRRSMSEKRHATLDAKSTDTYQRSKKARQEREQAAAENSGEVGPTLGMKKSSSLESLQTMMLEMKMETARPPATRVKGSRVVRGRGCNESFRAAVDRSYEAQEEEQPDQEIIDTFDRAEYRQSGSSLDSNNEQKKKKNNKMFKGFGMFKFGKQRAKSSDSGRLSAQERKTPTTELNYGSQRAERATPVGELEEGANRGQDEAQARMLAEQARIQQHYRRLVQQRQESENAGGGKDLVEEVYSGGHQHQPGGPAAGHQLQPGGHQHQHQHPGQHQDTALPASLAAARPGSRSGITGTPSDPRFANYEEIQRHLSRRQAQYHSQRREHPARSERPVSNFYEYESVQGLQGMHGRQPSLGSQGSGHLSQGSGHHQTGLPSGTNMPAGYRTVSPPRQDQQMSHYRAPDGPPPYVRQPRGGEGRSLDGAGRPPPLSVAPLPQQQWGRGDYEERGSRGGGDYGEVRRVGGGGDYNEGGRRGGENYAEGGRGRENYEDPYGRLMFRQQGGQRRPSQPQLIQQRSQSHTQGR